MKSMKRFAYVVTITAPLSENRVAPFSFQHTIVSAKNEESAYAAGHQWAAAHLTLYTGEQLGNDYVFPVQKVETNRAARFTTVWTLLSAFFWLGLLVQRLQH
jgi:hypothetical protein